MEPRQSEHAQNEIPVTMNGPLPDLHSKLLLRTPLSMNTVGVKPRIM